MKLAVMQPYFFPYIGYFQMVNAVDTFVFYDDVTFIKNGLINRNRILLNGKDHYLTVPCTKASSYKLINEINFDPNRKEFKKLVKTIEQAYKKAPYFEQVYPLIERILETPTDKIAILAEQSVIEISKYLKIQTAFRTSSMDFPETKGLDKADRLIKICQKEYADNYINALGGKELYGKSFFEENGIQLEFIKSLPVEYKQFNNEFVPWLSMIDVLMFNSVVEIKKLLNQFELV